MAKLPVAEIKKLALSIIADHPGGIRYSELVKAISGQHPETPLNTIHGSVWNLAAIFPKQVSKPSRGLFKPASATDGEEPDEKVGTTTTVVAGVKLKEDDACPLRSDEGNVEAVENFVTYYYLKPDPQRVPAMLDIVLKGHFLDDGERRVLVAQAFGYMGRRSHELIRLYESRFTGATDAGRSFLVEALKIFGDEVTRSNLEKWSRDPAYKSQQKSLEKAATLLGDPRRLSRDRQAERPIDLDSLWADFFVTGEYAPVARILDTLDQPGNLWQKISDCLKENSGKAELLEELKDLKLIQPDSKDKLVEGDLELILLHDAKGRLVPDAIQAAVHLGKQRLNMSDDELNRGVLLKGTASWSLQDNLEEHSLLAELMKKHYRERPSKSQDLMKKWLRIDQPKVVLDKESELLQGTWQAIGWQEDGDLDDPKLLAQTLKYVRWKFEDNELTTTKAFVITTEGRSEVKGEGTPWISPYKIDASKTPKMLILTSINPEKGIVTKCIYAIEDDALRICMSKKDQVPSSFSAEKGSGCILVTLKKATKR